MNTKSHTDLKIKKVQILSKQLENIQGEEQKILNKKENTLLQENSFLQGIQGKVLPFMDKLQGKIPPKLLSTLDTAFYKSFQLVFEKGNTYIEKTYNKDQYQLEFDLNNYAVDKYTSKKYIHKLDTKSNQSKTLNISLTAVEGTVLGLFGIGLPDIPLFIAVIIRTIDEIALSYGYDYSTDGEKAYMMLIICAAMTKGEVQKDFDFKVDELGRNLETKVEFTVNVVDEMKKTARILSESLLTAKFIQGLPVVGVIGGVVNTYIVAKIGKYAGLKYKKRYLSEKITKIQN